MKERSKAVDKKKKMVKQERRWQKEKMNVENANAVIPCYTN